MKKPAYILLALVFCLTSSCNDTEKRKESGATLNEDGAKNLYVDWLNTIVIPKVEFKGATIGEAIEYAWYHTKTSDAKVDEPTLGISIIVKAPHPVEENNELDADAGVGADAAHNVVNYTGENVPFFDLITEIVRQGRRDAYLTSVGIIITPEGDLPFPNGKAKEGEIWKVLRKSEKQ